MLFPLDPRRVTERHLILFRYYFPDRLFTSGDNNRTGSSPQILLLCHPSRTSMVRMARKLKAAV